MDEELPLSFLLNNGVAVGVMWFVLFKLNSTLKELTTAIHAINERLNIVENNQRLSQLQLNDLKIQINNLKHNQ